MKKLVFIISMVFLLKPVLPVLDYAINYDYISKTLCVNKAKPMMHCNGKCHLMKELAKAAENEKPISSDKKSSVQDSEVLFCEKISELSITPSFYFVEKKRNSHYADNYVYQTASSFFHPPAV